MDFEKLRYSKMIAAQVSQRILQLKADIAAEADEGIQLLMEVQLQTEQRTLAKHQRVIRNMGV